MTRNRARTVLGTTCVVGAMVLIVLVAIQLLMGRYDGREAEFWKWFLPNILPLTALLAAGLITDQRLPAADNEPVDTTSFRLALLLCCVYLGLLLLSIVIAAAKDADPMPTLGTANWFLSFLQALVTGVLGVYFTKLRPQAPPAVAPGKTEDGR